MTNLSIAYHFGQIRHSYRGNLALFMNQKEGEDNGIEFQAFPLMSDDLVSYTAANPSMMRAYFGVNERAQPEIIRRWDHPTPVRSAFDLDIQIVGTEVVNKRAEEVSDFETKVLNGLVAMGG